tara:strand:+ start:75 stop:1079 length:1005 start_codon:yes stop_codon:yes gene_type:complete
MIDLKLLAGKYILVTGGAGFIGSNLCDKLISLNTKVRCLDNFSTGKKSNILQLFNHPNFDLVEGDITDFETCEYATKSIDYVLHQAALGSVPRSIQDPLTTNRVNIEGFLNILHASVSNNVKKFIYAASSSTYGDLKSLPKVENIIGNPLSPYAITKYANELYAGVFSSIYGIKTVGLRYFNVFGKRQDVNGPYAAVIPRFISSLMEYKSPTINGDGSYSRDFTHVDNVIQMNLRVLLIDSLDLSSKIYNTAVGHQTTITELFEKIRSSLAYFDKKIANISPEYGDIRKGDVPHSLASIDKAVNELGYNPDVFVNKGIKKTVEWFYNSRNAKTI